VFAYAVLKLCEDGILSLDRPLTTYSTERLLDDPRVDLITARRVLCHTTGLPNWRSGPLSLAFTPGERWSYSGEGYWYLQSVITQLLGHVDPDNCSVFEDGLRVCATNIGDYLKANVLTPFGMTSSGYIWNDEYETRVAQGHDAHDGDRVRKVPRRGDRSEAAGHVPS
jgi:CubicO group peptidase (beta-lactamase class C family)